MKTWLITGCSSGFGQRLALAAARRGDQVIATARNVKTIEKMAEPFGDRMITMPLDVTDGAAAKVVVAKAIETFGLRRTETEEAERPEQLSPQK